MSEEWPHNLYETYMNCIDLCRRYARPKHSKYMVLATLLKVMRERR